MFFKGDTIVYATTGVCVIDDIREQACTGEVHTYYVLQPVFDSSSKVFAPVGSSEQKMRAVLTAGEADELVRTLPDAPAEWIDNDSRRKERAITCASTRKRLRSADIAESPAKADQWHTQKKFQKGLDFITRLVYNNASRPLWR